MKNSLKKIVPIGGLLILIIFSDCDIMSSDPCESTILLPTRNITVKAAVSFSHNDEYIPYASAKVYFHKIACGDDDYKVGGDFEFYGNTNSEGVFTSGTVGYNLRNENDKIIAEVFYSEDDPFTVAENERNYTLIETFVYRATDFPEGMDSLTKELQLVTSIQ